MAKLTALTKNTSGLNSGAEVMAQRISLDKIIVHPTFQTLLPINEKELANIVKDMEENGFDKSKPVVYLASVQQEEPLSISQWEEKLKTRGTE